MVKSNAQKNTGSDRVFSAVNHALILLVLLVCAFPLYYTVIASVSEPEMVLTGKVVLWPKGLTLDTYRSVFRYKTLWQGYLNTLWYTSIGTAYNLILLIPASYALSKRGLKGRNFLMGLFVFTMYFSGGMVPAYLNIKKLGLLNTRWALVIPGALSVYNMIIARTFFLTSYPEELSEAAKIDGAGEFRIFIRLVLPLSSSIIAVMTLYHAVAHWNSYFSALLYLSDGKDYPLQLILRQVLLQSSSVAIDASSMTDEEMMDQIRMAKLAETMKYAIIFLANAPVLIMYPFVQKYFVKGVMIGAIKG